MDSSVAGATRIPEPLACPKPVLPSSVPIKTRRGYGRKNKKFIVKKASEFTIIGTNAGGLNRKRDSLFNVINQINPSVVTIQETKFMREGSLKIPGYQIFECTRPESKSGGGLLTAALNNLDPLLITKDKETEILVIQVNVNGNNIRIINGYGCQEDDNQREILNFWQRLEEEIIEAKNEQCAIVIELDANAKLGGKQIKGDPNMLCNNGKIMSSILERQNLFVGNKLSNGKGVITRKRTLVDGTVEESVIDYILLCDKMVEFVEDVIIDEFKLKKIAVKITFSDRKCLI